MVSTDITNITEKPDEETENKCMIVILQSKTCTTRISFPDE